MYVCKILLTRYELFLVSRTGSMLYIYMWLAGHKFVGHKLGSEVMVTIGAGVRMLVLTYLISCFISEILLPPVHRTHHSQQCGCCGFS